MRSDAIALPPEALTFLSELKQNNDRDWFQAHKGRYEEHLKAPLLTLAGALSERIAEIAPAYATAPEKAVRRIYRDVRFSTDKTPYRTEVEILFAHRDLGKKGGTGLHMSVSPEHLQITGGLYWQDAAGLHKARQHVSDKLAALEKILRSQPVRKAFGSLSGELMKRPPRAFLASNPAAPLLQRTQWLLQCSLPAKTITEGEAVDTVFERFRILLPFVQFFEVPLLDKSKPTIFE